MKYHQPPQPKQEYLNRSTFTTQYLNLETFKTVLCTIKHHHVLRTCVYYHSSKDKRRSLGTYSCFQCPAPNNCLQGDQCSKAHNQMEVYYHPDKYKTQFCKFYPYSVENCEYQELCAFAHSKNEMAIDLLHLMEPKDADFYCFYFKTVWCPWVYEHEKDRCVYAHNWYDFRRRTQYIQYTEDMCHMWKNKEKITDYKNGCTNGHNCLKSHGRKESLYHVNHYKVNMCYLKNKCIKLHCPYAHNVQELRVFKKDSHFIYLPRNRKNSFVQVNRQQMHYKDKFENKNLHEISNLFAYTTLREDWKNKSMESEMKVNHKAEVQTQFQVATDGQTMFQAPSQCSESQMSSLLRIRAADQTNFNFPIQMLRVPPVIPFQNLQFNPQSVDYSNVHTNDFGGNIPQTLGEIADLDSSTESYKSQLVQDKIAEIDIQTPVRKNFTGQIQNLVPLKLDKKKKKSSNVTSLSSFCVNQGPKSINTPEIMDMDASQEQTKLSQFKNRQETAKDDFQSGLKMKLQLKQDNAFTSAQRYSSPTKQESPYEAYDAHDNSSPTSIRQNYFQMKALQKSQKSIELRKIEIEKKLQKLNYENTNSQEQEETQKMKEFQSCLVDYEGIDSESEEFMSKLSVDQRQEDQATGCQKESGLDDELNYEEMEREELIKMIYKLQSIKN